MTVGAGRAGAEKSREVVVKEGLECGSAGDEDRDMNFDGGPVKRLSGCP